MKKWLWLCGLPACLGNTPTAVIPVFHQVTLQVQKPTCAIAATSQPLTILYQTDGAVAAVAVEQITATSDILLTRAAVSATQPGALQLPASGLVVGKNTFVFWIDDPAVDGDPVQFSITGVAPVDATASSDDADGDCYSPLMGDCNDNDASVNPGATELCGDKIDNNCNGQIDCADTACATSSSCLVTGTGPPVLLSASRPSGSTISPHLALVFVFNRTLDTGSLTLTNSLGVTASGAFSSTTANTDTVTITPQTAWPTGGGKTLNFSLADTQANAYVSPTFTYLVDATAPLARFVPSFGTNEPTAPTSNAPTEAYLTSSGQSLVVLFNKSMDATSAVFSGIASAGTAVAKWTTNFVVNDTLTVAPPPGGWPNSGTLTITANDAPGNPTTTALSVDLSKQLFSLPVVTIPVVAYQLCNDDGTSNCAGVVKSDVTPMVAMLNQVYAIAGVQFTYSESDFHALASTNLNQCPDTVRGASGALSGNCLAGESDLAAVVGEGVGTPNLMPGLVVLFHDGAGPATDGWSATDDDFVMMPNTAHSCPWMLAHAVGHYLGLFDTAPYPAYADVDAAFAALSGSQTAFDGDLLISTPPDPYVGPQGLQCSPPANTDLFVGTEDFVLPVDNAMSFYFSDSKTLTTEQAFTVRQGALARFEGQSVGSMFSGTNVVFEGEKINTNTVTTISGNGQQQMQMREASNNFGAWSGNQNEWWPNNGGSSGSINVGDVMTTLTLKYGSASPSYGAGQYHLYMVLTKAGGYGVFGLQVNRVNATTPPPVIVNLLGGLITRPTLPIDLGTYTLTGSNTDTIAVTYEGTKSTVTPPNGQQFGFDYILLQH